MPLPNREHLEFICRHMNETFKIPFYLYNSNGELLFKSISSHRQNPMSTATIDDLIQLIKSDDPSEYPLIKSTKLLENYLVVNLKSGDIFYGSMIGGPSIYTNYSEDMLRRVNHDIGLYTDLDRISLYYQSLPVIKNNDLMQIGIHVHYMIYQQVLDLDYVNQQNLRI
jgi:hypothetical protein